MNHAVSIEVSGEIAIVTISNPPVNAISHDVRVGVLDAVTTTKNDDNIKAVVLICDGRTFIAGADIREFGKPLKAPILPDVILALENSSKPWVAAIHGTALGGGLEIALGCHYRIGLSSAKLGLPEVNLGLIPGAGGTVRLPRCIAMQDAIGMITSGKPIAAQKAHSLGLLNSITDENLRDYSIKFAKSISAEPLPRSLLLNCVIDPISKQEQEALRLKLLKKARGQTSIMTAFDTISIGAELEPIEALKNERAQFVKLQSDEQSKALRHIFFAERSTGKLEELKGAQALDIKQIGVIGGGTMGAAIAALCLLSDFKVTLIEMSEEASIAAHERIISILDGSLKRGLISEDKKAKLVQSLTLSCEYQSLNDVELVIEAVFEDMEIKKQVFQKLEKATKPDTILATNTSYLDVNEIANAIQSRQRVIGLHFFSPAHIMKLLEIIRTDYVSPNALATSLSLAKRLRKIAVVAGVCDGFIGNRIMSAYRRRADYLLEDGATPEDIDKAMTDFGFPMGIFDMQDLAGLDIGWAMRQRLAPTRDPNIRYVEIADRLCELGRFGKKTNTGWYSYSTGTRKNDPKVQAIIDEERSRKNIVPRKISQEEIINSILGAMQEEANAVLEEGIASKASDIDVVMVNGYGFPRYRGGPMFMQMA